MNFSLATKAICTAIVALAVSTFCASAQVLSFDQAKQRADQGDAFAQAVVAMHYQLGWDTQKNLQLAAAYAVASMNAGHPLGMFRVGALLRAGEPGPKDETQGLAYQEASFTALYQAEDPYSLTCVAIMIFQGKVVGQNTPEDERRRDAAAFYKKAADMGYAPAQFNYAMALNDGHGVKKDSALFEQYLAKARASSYPLAVSFSAGASGNVGTPQVAATKAPTAEGAEIDQLVNQGDLQGARRLAVQWRLASNDPSHRAEASYYIGVVDFLAGNSDGDAERMLGEALSLYRQMSPSEPVGHWRTLYVLQKLYFDQRAPTPNAWTTLAGELNEVEKAARRICIGVPIGAGGGEIYEELRRESSLQSLTDSMDLLLSQIGGDSVHGKRTMKDQRAWEQNRNRDLDLYGFGRNGQLPRLQYYAEGRQKIDDAKAESLELAKGLVTTRIEELSRIVKELSMSEASGRAANAIEGFTSGERWAYEYIEHKVEPTTTLATDSSGLIVFADSNLVVRAAEFRGTVAAGSIKTELSFFDTRSGKLQAVVALPNRVFQVGRVEATKADLFYVGTVTAAKYCYDDYPMALTLVDLESRKLERIPLVQEDYWLALNNDVQLASSGNQLLVKVQPGLSGQYISNRPASSSFRMLQVAIEETSNPEEQPYHHDINEARHASLVDKDSPALSYLGAASVAPTDPAKTRGVFAVGSNGSNSSFPKILKLDHSGQLILFDLSSLQVQTLSAGRKDALNPHIFGDGSIACIAGPYLHLFRGQEAIKIPLPKADERSVEALANANDYQPGARMVRPEAAESGPDTSVVKVAYSDQSVGYQFGNDFFRANASGDSQFSPVSLSGEAFAKMQEGIRRGSVDGLSEDLANEILKKAPSEVVQDWEPVSNTFVVSDGGFLEWFRIDAETGETIGPSLTGGAKGAYGGTKYSNTCGGWRAYSFINDSHTGGHGVCLNLEQVGSDRDPLTVADDLPNITEPLSIQTLEGKCLILYGAEDSLNLVAVNLGSGEQRLIKAWRFPARFGKALCDYKSGTLFIPTAAGFEVWSVWQNKPSKRFNLILGEGDQYAVLLPNGSYAGSPGCESLLRLRAGNGSVDGASVAAWRNRPAEVLKALGGDPEQIEVLAKVTERWQKRIGFDPAKPEPKASDLPKVSVPERPPLWAKGDEVVFTIQWEKSASPLRDIIVHVNGVESARFEGDTLPAATEARGSVDATVKLAEGQNWIEVTAEDVEGRRSDLQRFRTILKDSPTETKRYIIALGVSDYARPELNLQFAAKDAKDLLEALAGKGAADTGLFAKVFGQSGGVQGSDNVLLLTNDEVDRSVVEKIRDFVGKSSESDEVILFCAGHGVLDDKLDYYFAGHDFDPDRPTETGIKLDGLVGAVSSAKALKRLVLLDTCHAGVVGEKDEMLLAQMNTKLPSGVRAVAQRGMKVQKAAAFSASDKQRFIEEMFSLPGTIRGVNIIGASAGAQFALESDKWNNGVFTASVIEGLRDKKADWNEDGRITVSELKNYLGQRVSELTAGAQKPSVVAFEQDQDFDLLN